MDQVSTLLSLGIGIPFFMFAIFCHIPLVERTERRIFQFLYICTSSHPYQHQCFVFVYVSITVTMAFARDVHKTDVGGSPCQFQAQKEDELSQVLLQIYSVTSLGYLSRVARIMSRSFAYVSRSICWISIG